MIRLTPFFIVSLVLHCGFLTARVPWTDQLLHPGDPRGIEEMLFVEVVAEKEVTACATTPATNDSIASKESQPEKELPAPQEKQEEPPPTPEEPVREPVVKEETLPQPVLATASEDDKADFISTDWQTPDPPEPVEEKKQEREIMQESPKTITSVSQIASRRSAFRASRGSDLADFKAKVISAIRKASFYPTKAGRKGQLGQVVVRFRIWRDGRVDGIEVVGSSGSELLDKAAREILQNAVNDFPSVPDFVQETFMAYAVPIVFRDRHKAGK